MVLLVDRLLFLSLSLSALSVFIFALPFGFINVKFSFYKSCILYRREEVIEKGRCNWKKENETVNSSIIRLFMGRIGSPTCLVIGDIFSLQM